METVISYKEIIEKLYEQMKEKNPLLVRARLGRVELEQVTTYLHNVMFFFHHTPIHLELARKKSIRMEKNDLADFFEEKIREEAGHENWAKNDLKELGLGLYQNANLSKILPGTLNLLVLAKKSIHKNPALFIPYMFYLEYITVLVGPNFLHDLETHCKIPTHAMTSIGKHAELDKLHVEDDLVILNKVSQDITREQILDIISQTHQCLEEMTSECINYYV